MFQIAAFASLLLSSTAQAEESDTLPGSTLALSGTLTTVVPPIAVLSFGDYLANTIDILPIPTAFSFPPIGVTMSHYGNKRMIAAMDGSVNTDAFDWGHKFSKISLVTGVPGAIVFSLPFVFYPNTNGDSPGGLTEILVGGGLILTSYASMLTATICYEVQRQRTLKAFKAKGQKASLEAPESHFNVMLAPTGNGMSLVGTF